MNSSSNPTQLRLSNQRFRFPGMVFKSSYQRYICPTGVVNNRQSARVSINDISERLGQTCCQDYTSAEKKKRLTLLTCLAGTDIMTGALGQPLFIAELVYRLIGSPTSEFCGIQEAA